MRPHPRLVTAAVILLSLFVHGLQAGALGLYWDDAVQLVQPFHAAGHDPIAFLLTDTSGALRSERPFAFLAFLLTRAAFLHGIAAVHWVLVGLLTLNALMIAAAARRLVDEDWFGFAAAAIFLTYPLAPLQPLWAATVHYQIGCLLVLVSILCLDPGPPDSPARPAWLSLGGYAAYLGGITTHEGLALVPPAFFTARWLCDPERRGRVARHLTGLLTVLALVAVWRIGILPRYGGYLYPLPPERLASTRVFGNMVEAVVASFAPWKVTLHYLRRPSSEAVRWVPAAAGAAALVGLTCAALMGRSRSRVPDSAWCGLAPAAAVVVAAGLSLAVSPIGIDYSFRQSYGPRGNFIVLPGVALFLPALAGAFRLRRIVTAAALAGMVFAGSLLHLSVKQAFADEWHAHRTRLATLRTLAPRLADSSLVIIFDQRDRRAPFADHYEMSSYVLALYGNWSLLANTTRHLRFYRDGVESTYHGVPGEWLAPGDHRALALARLRPVGRIGYDRVVLFRNDHGRLRAVPDTVVTAEDGTQVLLRSNSDRIIRGPPSTTPVWRHIAR